MPSVFGELTSTSRILKPGSGWGHLVWWAAASLTAAGTRNRLLSTAAWACLSGLISPPFVPRNLCVCLSFSHFPTGVFTFLSRPFCLDSWKPSGMGVGQGCHVVRLQGHQTPRLPRQLLAWKHSSSQRWRGSRGGPKVRPWSRFGPGLDVLLQEVANASQTEAQKMFILTSFAGHSDTRDEWTALWELLSFLENSFQQDRE